MSAFIPKAVWYSRSPAVAPLSVAVRNGWLDEAFAAVGIPLKSTMDHRDEQVRRAYFDHHIFWSFRQGGSGPALWARSQGAATRLIGLTWNTEFQGIISRPGSGIRSAGDLTGRRYGVPRYAPLGFDVSAAFAIKGLVSGRGAEGLTHEGVDLVDLPLAPPGAAVGLGRFGLGGFQAYAAEARALLDGRIDAFYVKGGEGVAIANAIGASLVCEFGAHPDRWIRLGAGNPRPLTIGEEFCRRRPDLVDVVIREFNKVPAWARENPDEALRVVARESRVSEQAMAVSLGEDIGSHLGLSLDAEGLAAFDRYKKLLVDWSLLERDFSFDEWVEPGPLLGTGLRH
ncbi:ABC transporter substrate-binding protein [Oleomonas cavernae]|uniref:ABC transporter substrate-binding protein n=1 Tax=Oleomonas cavernae TaxID=2320859 RepID=A0A418W8J3_9PROT|nr:ABC transporter substrate-binding protein [Oleomonas cavernae]RJF86331.1 ABC transporter substrate-binding protein [Oleomonas cavernae]